MINQTEFCTYLQKILDDNTVITDVVFKVRTLDLPFFDTMARKIDDTNDTQITILPVMVEQSPEGGYDPTPGLGMWDGTLNVTLLFPLAELSNMELLYDYVAQKLSGAIDTIGDISGKCVMAVGQRTFGQMQLLDVGQFSQINQQVMAYYGKEVRVTREWLSMTFQVDFASGANVGKANGIIYGNQITRRLLFKYYDETVSLWYSVWIGLTPVDSSSANSVMPFSQQYINGKETTSIPSCSAKGVSFTAYVKDSRLWLTFIKANKENHLNDGTYFKDLTYQEFFKSAVTNENVFLYSGSVIITEMGFTGGYGEPLTCSMSLAPKGEVLEL